MLAADKASAKSLLGVDLRFSFKVFEEIGEKLKGIGWSFSYTKAEAKQVRH